MINEASIVLAQANSSDVAADDGSVNNPTATSDQESTDVSVTDNADTADADDTANGGDNAGEGGDQSTSSETYADLQMPEGVELDQSLLDGAVPLFEKYNVSKEDAQAFADLQASHVQASQQGQAEAFNQLKLDWQDQSKNDPEIGGDKFEQSVSDAREALGKFGTPELTKLLNDFGIGNHPEIIRVMSKVGSLTKEDVPGGGNPASNSEKSRVDILYPSDS
jgi:hypothetical protein